MPTTAPVTLLGLSGSLREASGNSALLRAARELAPADVEVVVHPIGDLPFFDRDLEVLGAPDEVARFREAVEAADGLLLATPEYNASTSAVLKNAIDWASRGRPAPLDGKPVALLSAAGRSGGARAQSHVRDMLRHNRARVLDDSLQVVRAWDHLEGGRLVTEAYRRELADLLVALRDLALDGRAAA